MLHVDIREFHEKFGLDVDPGHYSTLDDATYKFREMFMEEELQEFKDAKAKEDLPGMADALVDLVYVAIGTAHLMGLPWQRLWFEVHQANMAKVMAKDKSESKRNSSIDVVKPDGWKEPDISSVLFGHASSDEERTNIRHLLRYYRKVERAVKIEKEFLESRLELLEDADPSQMDLL